jgi:Cyclic GMP-AMP synthase DncV-like, nucleotidyltransferase domain
MPTANSSITDLLSAIVDHLDIPRSYYEKAAARHKSLGEWLCRPNSSLAGLSPPVSPQGSFRFGTVIRPLLATEEYDLDNVAVLGLAKTAMTQRQLKNLYGLEIAGYAKANGIAEPVQEKDRCWRLVYADEVRFHLDTLPCVPEEQAVIVALISRGVPPEWAARAIGITDRRHPDYDLKTSALLSSNPRGFARWFESRARTGADARLRQLVERRLYASVEDVPPYEWKTTLQGSIQLLKRHRDVMFRENSALAPISMIITNLAANAYGGETDLWSALNNIAQKMTEYVRSTRPRVPNPTDPAEDYADKWTRDRQLEEHFWLWHTQLKVDLARFPTLLGKRGLASAVYNTFRVELTQEEIKQFEQPQGATTPAITVSTPALHIPSAPRPWGYGD